MNGILRAKKKKTKTNVPAVMEVVKGKNPLSSKFIFLDRLVVVNHVPKKKKIDSACSAYSVS